MGSVILIKAGAANTGPAVHFWGTKNFLFLKMYFSSKFWPFGVKGWPPLGKV